MAHHTCFAEYHFQIVIAISHREWYSYHFPEMIKIASENYQYCRLAKLIGNRKCIMSATEEMKEKIEEITMDSAKAEAIISASKMSMGMYSWPDICVYVYVTITT